MSMLCLFVFAQTRSISGTVIDDLGEPVIGANVIEEGTTNGAITDFDGNFKLTVASSKSKIKVTYIGYTPQVLTVGTQTEKIAERASNPPHKY